MQSQEPRNPHFMITKEVFIDHIPSEIQQYYEVNPKCLGQGGFGKVFQAKKKRKLSQITNKDSLGSSFSSFGTCSRVGQDEKHHSQSRAIKQISYHRSEDKEMMKNEIEILSYLDHPSIVKLYETYEYKKKLYLVIDHLKGGDLFTVIDDKNRAGQSEVRLIFQQLIKALNYLHSQHICHRDLKLENILFLDQHSYNLKLIDFGLAFCWEEDMRKQLKEQRKNIKIAGTPDYMSPEMLAHDYDQRCDIWSVGVILYGLLSGVSPFSGDNDKQIMRNIKNYNYTFQIPEFKDVSQSAKDLIQKMFKPENQRISLVHILNHPWLKQSNCTHMKCLATTSDESLSSGKNLLVKHTDLNRKFNATRSFDGIKRKGSANTLASSQFQFGCKSYYSQESSQEERPQQLTVQKLEHYSSFLKLQKLFAIYSVSKLSESKTQSYGRQFLLIDKNNDGTISLEDLTEYLFQNEKICDKQSTQFFFNELAVSQRGYISYTQYLACVLSYQSQLKAPIKSEQFEFDQRFPFEAKISFFQQNTFTEQIDIYDDYLMFDLFDLLDKDKNGFISKQDLMLLLQDNGIEERNQSLLQQLQGMIHEIQNAGDSQERQVEKHFQWEDDPRKFKRLLSRTYKGEKDGGTLIDFKTFKHLIKSHEGAPK